MVASQLCTWMVTTCVSAPNEWEICGQSSRRWRFSKKLIKRRDFGAPIRRKRGGSFMSALYGSGKNSLMKVCPMENCCNVSCVYVSGDNALSSFGRPVSRPEQRQLCQAASHADNTLAEAEHPVKPSMPPKKKGAVKKRRVVVTGLGVVTPLGHEADEFYNKLLAGVSGISLIESFDCTPFPTKIAGEIKSFSTDGWVAPKLSKRADKFMLYLMTAGKKALADGGITDEVSAELDKSKCGVIIGSSLGGLKVLNDSIEALRISPKKMSPFCVPYATINMGSAILAIDLGWMGPNYSISAACATSNFCILNAASHIRRGDSDLMLCGGSDSALIPIGMGGLAACKVLSCRNDNPAKASRPWDAGSDGFVLGEGAGVLLLEELEHAKMRGAKIYAEFLGGSFTCDAYHINRPHPDGSGIVHCLEKALEESGVAREDVNYINAHAISMPSDMEEYRAVVQCFRQNSQLRMNATKCMIGHLLGAAGAVEAVATVKAIQTGLIHPNINFEQPNESLSAEDARILVGSKREELEVKVAASNSFGFGGHNSSILFAPYKE
ncbi:3-oxoacyl-[acyl-carrier-protein] synthase II, chloroplastic-like [Andrographis paniculata]|uniref:3-oxoacyl-[acyl-carrier-protein] synthase II, chloroplastic-like n=1 Tax=Andrographis paniculata TaxID=175694 RepID=UPI0021E78833|nr:3-oxoacyl-[acyl-carrier-protein] synthase II, chloroplastic-like [Andrographis paniculata]